MYYCLLLPNHITLSCILSFSFLPYLLTSLYLSSSFFLFFFPSNWIGFVHEFPLRLSYFSLASKIKIKTKIPHASYLNFALKIDREVNPIHNIQLLYYAVFPTTIGSGIFIVFFFFSIYELSTFLILMFLSHQQASPFSYILTLSSLSTSQIQKRNKHRYILCLKSCCVYMCIIRVKIF